jgi:hypothetical protein
MRKAKLQYVLVGRMSFFDRAKCVTFSRHLKPLDSPDDECRYGESLSRRPRGLRPSTVGNKLFRSERGEHFTACGMAA